MLQRRYHHARHLSNSRLFLGHEGMLALGLPRAVMPWYPVLSVPFTAVWHGAHRVWPGGKRRLVERGRKAQLEALPVLLDARLNISRITCWFKTEIFTSRLHARSPDLVTP